ncbi:MFS transporter [Streptomyces xiaopingdaonensis]|uniref:MFS transporter n=1 Tax=Streptomyces xiaopingdaonensis TaxID=1565415 RepID=UPI000318B7FA|nr:MFS transporter [Streptomyces xiaopingdaonensis]
MSTSTNAVSAPPTSLRQHRRALAASSVGNLMEQYDNLVYAYSATVLGALFFPSENDAVGVLSTFAVFAVGFFARPLGTIVFGHIGDRLGRRPALVLSVVVMGLATALIGCLPTYDSIGALAPVLLVVLRLFQGFAVAGEWAGSAAMLVEFAPPGRRGVFGSFNQVSTAAGFLVAAAVVAANSAVFSDEAMLAYGWRVPFLLGGITAAVAVLLRMGLEETPAFVEDEEAGARRSPLRTAFAQQKTAMFQGFCFTVGWTVAYFFFLTYLPTYLRTEAGIDPDVVSVSNLVGTGVLTVSIALFGLWSDRIGRKRLLLVGSGGFVVLSFPVMMLFGTGHAAAVYIGQILIALTLACFSGPGPAALAELFPTSVRYSALGIGYNFSVMAFGGTAAFIASGIVAATGVPLAVAALPAAAALVTFLTVCTMPESYRSPLR